MRSRLAPPRVPSEFLAEDNLDEVSERLTAGLATCRSMIENYTSLIRTGPMMAAEATDAAQDADAESMSGPD